MNNIYISKLYIIRHGYSVSNYIKDRDGNYDNSSKIKDPLLHQIGINQAEQISSINWDELIDEAYSSPLRRACQTGNIALKNYNIPIYTFKTLRESWWHHAENRPLQLGYSHILDSLKYKNRFKLLDNLNYPSKYWDVNLKDSNIQKESREFMWNKLKRILKKKINKKGVAIFCHWGTVDYIINKIIKLNPSINFTHKNKNCCVFEAVFIYDNSKNIRHIKLDLVNKINRCL